MAYRSKDYEQGYQDYIDNKELPPSCSDDYEAGYFQALKQGRRRKPKLGKSLIMRQMCSMPVRKT